MASRLLVDMGQSGTRLRIEPESAEPIRVQAPQIRADGSPEAHLSQVVEHALEKYSLPVQDVAAGLSGLQGARGDAESLLRQWAWFGVTQVVLADDAVTGYLAAIGSSPGVVLSVGTGVVGLAAAAGVVLSVGTGVVGLAAAEHGAFAARVNGWGYLVGDEGGGYAIGRAGLQAAMRAFDGRGPETGLLAAATATLGPTGSIGLALQRDPDRVRTIAAFARQVLGLASSGDAAAADICSAAAAELALTVDAAARRAGCHGEQILVSWSGSLLTGNLMLRGAFGRELALLDRGYVLTAPVGTALDGARLMIDLPATHPFAALISRAAATNEAKS